MENQTMNARDSISAALAECFCTVEGQRYNFMQMIDLSAEMKKTKTKVPILGKPGKGNRSTGWEGTFSGTAHFNQSIFRRLLYQYKQTGKDIYFDMQITNWDDTSSIGRQTIILKDCNLDGGILAKFDADGEYLDEDVNGTFEDWEMPEQFTLLEGML